MGPEKPKYRNISEFGIVSKLFYQQFLFFLANKLEDPIFNFKTFQESCPRHETGEQLPG